VSTALLVDPRTLKSNPWNSNVVSPENEAKLDEALRTLGFFKPIVVREVDGDLQILGGEHRRDAAIRIGMDEVPIFNLGPISDDKAKKIGLADNARYGADDTLMLAAILEDLGDTDDLQSFLPMTGAEIASIFSASSIALDDLDLDDKTPDKEEAPEPPATKAPKTHTVMRFKVALGDAEKITEQISKIQKRHGYTAGDELTNAGDALVHLLLGTAEPEVE
jgi:ParB-like chromosome segregation protein Spo0J